ncbi:unnamed protein product, partial [Laminaria digitata]
AGCNGGLGELCRRRRRSCLPRDSVLSAVVEIKDVRVETKKTAADGDMDTEKVSAKVKWSSVALVAGRDSHVIAEKNNEHDPRSNSTPSTEGDASSLPSSG